MSVMQPAEPPAVGVPAARLALGLAALGRPGYITLDHHEQLGTDRTVEAMRRRAGDVMDAAHAAGVRHVDVARSYGLAEDFVAWWLAERPDAGDVIVSSKWGYRYVGDWRVDADVHEVKDHSVAAFRRQWAETSALLGERVVLYQVHSITPESPALRDRALIDELATLRDTGVRVGLSTSGPRQAEVVREALGVRRAGIRVFSAVQATWNLLEPSVQDALEEAADSGWWVIVKEALANGRLAGPATPAALAELATEIDASPDAVALAAALALPSRPTVLLGAISTAQLRSNLNALSVDSDAVQGRLSELAEPPASYWDERSELAWH